MHTRADPYDSDPRLVRIGLPYTLAPIYQRQFGSAIRTNEVRIKRTEPCGSGPFGSCVNPRIGSKKKVQIGTEANFVYRRGLSTSFAFYFMASWNVDVKYVFIPNWIHLDPLPCARKLFWLRSRVHAAKILDQIHKTTEPYGFALVCTGS